MTSAIIVIMTCTINITTNINLVAIAFKNIYHRLKTNIIVINGTRRIHNITSANTRSVLLLLVPIPWESIVLWFLLQQFSQKILNCQIIVKFRSVVCANDSYRKSGWMTKKRVFWKNENGPVTVLNKKNFWKKIIKKFCVSYYTTR